MRFLQGECVDPTSKQTGDSESVRAYYSLVFFPGQSSTSTAIEIAFEGAVDGFEKGIGHIMQHEPRRSKTSGASSLWARRFTGITLVPRSSSIESSDDIRGHLGLNLLHEPSEPLIDFIFVHGLRGGSRKTWSKTDDPAHFWPKEWLPNERRFKHVRIHSFGYNSDWGERKESIITIHDFGQALLGDIQNTPSLNEVGKETPLVLIGHSMGGVVIKKALLLARQDPNHRKLADRIHSMFFLATPHRGADSAQMLSNMLKIAVFHGTKPYVDNIIPKSDAIQAINDGFRHACHGIQLWSFFETVKTSLGLIVEKSSAVLDLPGERVQLLNADHRHVCKFDDPTDSNYCTVRNAFSSTIVSIEKTWLSARSKDHESEMRVLSVYLGLLDSPEADLANIVDVQTEGSCDWLTDSHGFQNWQQSVDDSPKHFWLSGEPATGKSTLSGHVVKYLQDSNGDCSHFFFKHGGAGKSTIADLLCSLAWQMASSNTEIRQKILSLREEGVSIDRTDERSLWRTIFITRVFRTELRQPHYWVIDGLDECSNQAAIFSLLGKVDKSFPLRIFVASRPSLTIERSFSQEKIIKTQQEVTRDKTLNDIKLFLETHAHYLPADSEADREELIELILQKSNGNFLWTKLVVKELEEAHSQQRVREVLESVPKGIDHLYSRILTNVMATPRNSKLVMAILRWVVCAARPLTVEELKDAIWLDTGEAISQMEKTAGSICGNLIYVDSQLNIRPAHQTVQEYLFREKEQVRFAVRRPEAHTRISEVCLKYLSGDEMKIPRHRRGSMASRHRTRSAFAKYSVQHFSDHLVRSMSSVDEHLFSLNSFLQSNSLTWIEILSESQDLSSLTKTAKNLKTYLERRAKHKSPLGTEVSNVSEWTNDLIHLVAQFGKPLIASPASIHFLIPPICPPESIIHKTFGGHKRGLRIEGLSQKHWDDRLCCIIFSNAQALTVACRDNKFALGKSDGAIQIYDETSFQIQLKLLQNEPVRCLAFANINTYIASAGRRRISLWNTLNGNQLWTASVADQPLAIEFNEDDTILMVATRENSMHFWSVQTGNMIDKSQFSDINEDDQSEYRYKRPPLLAAFSPGLNLLGVAYRQRPVNFWDLEDKTFVGQYHKSGAVYPEPLIEDFIFNPNIEISLAAIAYNGGDVVVFDPWTQHTDAAVAADATVLAASPDGTVLATGSGNGVIKIFEFETLKMFYQINSHQENIRAISFNSNNLRFLDIRGNHCNVWEPSTLVRRTASGDDSSLDFSDTVIEGPKYSVSRVFDDYKDVSSIVAHHDCDYIFCGRENGSLAAYASDTGLVMQEVFDNGRSVAIRMLEWNKHENLLGIVDRSGEVTVRRLAEKASPELLGLSEPLLHHESSSLVRQILFNPDGTRILICTADCVKIWSLDVTPEPKGQHIPEWGSSSRWMCHPRDLRMLIVVTDTQARIFGWDALVEMSRVQGIELGTPLVSSLSVSHLVSTTQGQHVCMISLGPDMHGSTAAALRLWPTKLLTPEAESVKAAACYDEIAQHIKSIIGIYRSRLVFLNHSGWVCSLIIDDVSVEKFYTKHFYIPMNWHSTLEKMSLLVTSKGVIVMAIKNEIAVFHNGLEFEETVGVDGAMVSAKASMRSVFKRVSSDPAFKAGKTSFEFWTTNALTRELGQ